MVDNFFFPGQFRTAGNSFEVNCTVVLTGKEWDEYTSKYGSFARSNFCLPEVLYSVLMSRFNVKVNVLLQRDIGGLCRRMISAFRKKNLLYDEFDFTLFDIGGRRMQS